MIKLIEVFKLPQHNQYTLREIYVNPKHVVALREEVSFKQKLVEGQLPDDLDSRQDFTRLTLDRGQSGLDVVVIGAPHIIENKIHGTNEKQLLTD
mgnify:CR=1 FL=1